MITERVIIFDDIDDVFEHIVKTAVSLTNAEAATIRVFDIETGTLKIVKGYGVSSGFLTQPAVKIGEGIAGSTVEKGKLFSTNDATGEMLVNNPELVQLEGIKSILCIPMKNKTTAIGCITAYRKTTEPFDDHEMMLLSIFSSEAVEAIEKAKAINELKKQARLDQLTGLFNKKTIMEKIKLEIDRARRHSNNLSILFIDLDKFKEYNDINGHLMGDKLLYDFSNMLKSKTRSIDIIGRFGGDEFIIIAPQTGTDGSLMLAENLLKSINDFQYKMNESDTKHNVTCSIGISVYPDNSTDLDELIDKADKALYTSKKKGKNTYTLYSEMKN